MSRKKSTCCYRTQNAFAKVAVRKEVLLAHRLCTFGMEIGKMMAENTPQCCLSWLKDRLDFSWDISLSSFCLLEATFIPTLRHPEKERWAQSLSISPVPSKQLGGKLRQPVKHLSAHTCWTADGENQQLMVTRSTSFKNKALSPMEMSGRGRSPAGDQGLHGFPCQQAQPGDRRCCCPHHPP